MNVYKYYKYKNKYLYVRHLNIYEDMNTVLYEDEINEKYKNQNYFYNLYRYDNKNYKMLIYYIHKHFFPNWYNKSKLINSINSIFKKGKKADNIIYIKLQKLVYNIYTSGDKYDKKEVFDYLKKLIDDNYKNKILYNKAKQTKMFIKNVSNENREICLKHLDKIKDNGFILDIGTEDIKFLDDLKLQFNTENVFGLNIEKGYEHYGNYYRNTDDVPKNKILLYDGTNVAESDDIINLLSVNNIDCFDLITIISVLHHIKASMLEEWICNVCKITNTIYIKDNNIGNIPESHNCTNNNIICYFIEIQHNLYEGILYPGNRNYINLSLLCDNVIKYLVKYKFKILHCTTYKDSKFQQFEIFAEKIN